MKLKLFVGWLAAAHLAAMAQAQDAPELQRLQSGYNTAVQRAVRPLTQSYFQELSRLRDNYLATNRAAEARQVELEIKLVTERVAAMDKSVPGAPVPPLAVARPPAEPPPTAALGNSNSAGPGNRVLVSDAKAKIRANSPNAYPLGDLRKGDVVTLQYQDGLWKAYGHVASESPDAVVQERGHQDESRLVIAHAGSNGKEGTVIAIVPAQTVKTPFNFTVPEDHNDLVLRIHKNSEDRGNPGTVTYSVKITR